MLSICRSAWLLLFLVSPALNSPANADSVLTVALSQSLNNLDPARIQIGSEYNYANLVFNGLTYIDRNLVAQPDLAVSWSSNDDLTVWTFKLREGVRFHNGKDLTASDVVWTFRRILDPKSASRMRGNLLIVDQIVAVDLLTVRFTLKTPYADFPTMIGDYQGRIIPEGYEDQAKHPIGTGPFKFVEFVPGDRVVVRKNPDYWEPGLPKVDEVRLRIIQESATAISALQSGEVQIVADVRAEVVQRLANDKNVRVDSVRSGTFAAFVLRNDIPPFNDIRVRRALALALDKTEAVRIATFGQAAPTHTPIPPFHPYYLSDVPIPKADPERAKALLAEAGYPNGLELTYWYAANDSEIERLGVVFRDEARKAGMNVQLRGLPGDKYYADVEGKEPLTMTVPYGRPVPDLMLYPFFHSKGSFNLWAYRNPEFDQMLEAGREAKTDPERKAIYQAAQRKLLEDVPGVVVYVRVFSNAVRTSVQDFRSTPRIWLELKSVWLNPA
jgi:peptide/nickel transport system substrate-binding protein